MNVSTLKFFNQIITSLSQGQNVIFFFTKLGPKQLLPTQTPFSLSSALHLTSKFVK